MFVATAMVRCPQSAGQDGLATTSAPFSCSMGAGPRRRCVSSQSDGLSSCCVLALLRPLYTNSVLLIAMLLMWLVGAQAVHVLLLFRAGTRRTWRRGATFSWAAPSYCTGRGRRSNSSHCVHFQCCNGCPSGRPAGQGRPGRAGPDRSSGGACCGPDQTSGRHRGASPCTLHAHYAHYAHFSKLARPPKIKL